MRSDDRGKFQKENMENSWDNYAAHIDDNKRKELSKQGYGDLHESMPCPECGKPMLRANQLKHEKELANNPWFVKDGKPVHASHADKKSK